MNRYETYRTHIREIAEWIEAGATTAEILTEYTKKWECSERTIFRNIAMAEELLVGRLKDPDALLDAIRADAIADNLDNLLSNLEVEMVMCRIIEKGGEPNDIIRLKAINSLLRMRGSYCKREEKNTAKKKNAPTYEQFLEGLSEHNRKLVEKI